MDFTFQVGQHDMAGPEDQTLTLVTGQSFDIFTSLLFNIPGVMCLLDWESYGDLAYFFFNAALESAQYHGCRSFGTKNCPESDLSFWILNDLKASQFVLVVAAFLFGIHIRPQIRIIILLMWYMVHNFIWDSFLWPWLSMVAALIVAIYFLVRNIDYFNKPLLGLDFGIGLSACVIFYFEYQPRLYAWMHGVWHILGAVFITLLLYLCMKARLVYIRTRKP